MTFGQLAGLIAAIAFLILVIFACILLNQLSKTMKETNKSEQLDPAVKAVADVSQSVSEVNASLQEMVEKARLHREKRQFDRSIFKFAGKTLVFDAFNKFRQHRKQKKGMTNNE